MDRSCIIVEVALYPPHDKEHKVLLSDFSLRIAGTNTAVKPSAAKVVAANWQQQFRTQQDVKTELDGEVTLGPSVVHLEGQVRFEKGDSPVGRRFVSSWSATQALKVICNPYVGSEKVWSQSQPT